MIRHSPAEFYLKYLVVHPANYSNDRIVDLCKRDQLDPLSDEYLEQLRSSCVAPVPFYPKDPLHVKSQRFLYREKLQQLFIPDDDMRIALRLVKRSRAKEFTESMILAGAPLDRIAAALGPHRGFPASTRAVEYFKHYFWNTDLLDSTEMRALLQLRVPVAPENASDAVKKATTAYGKAYKEDPRVLAAELPNHPLVAMMSQMRMGFMPRKVDLVGIIEAARTAATMRALEATFRDGPFDSKKALEFSTVAKTMSEMLETVVKPDERLREELSTIALKTEEGPVPYIHQLSGGSHTVEMSPKAPNEQGREQSRSDSGADGNAD